MKSFAMNVKKCFVLYLFSFLAFRVPQSLSQLGCRKMYDTSNQSKCNMNAALVIEREEDSLPELTELSFSVLQSQLTKFCIFAQNCKNWIH